MSRSRWGWLAWLLMTSLAWAQPSGEQMVGMGDQAARQNDFTEAIRCYSQAVRLLPEGLPQAGAYLRWGEACQEIRQPLQAKDPFKQALALYDRFEGGDTSSSGYICSQLGQIYLDERQYSQAERYLERSLAIASHLGRGGPELTADRLLLAHLYFENTRYEEARQQITRLLPEANLKQASEAKELLAEVQRRQAGTPGRTTVSTTTSGPETGSRGVDSSFQYAQAVYDRLKASGKLKLRGDSNETGRVNWLGQKVASVAKPNIPWTFMVEDKDEPNAFTWGEGFVVVTEGLMQLGLTDDELAGVLAHEVAHGVKQHTMAPVNQQLQLRQALKEIQDAQALAQRYQQERLQGDDDSFQTRMVTVRRRLGEAQKRLAYLQGQLKYAKEFSYENETDADLAGLRYAAAAGFDPEGLMRALSKIQDSRVQAFGKDWTGAGRSHPATAQRIELLERVYHSWKSQGSPR